MSFGFTIQMIIYLSIAEAEGQILWLRRLHLQLTKSGTNLRQFNCRNKLFQTTGFYILSLM